jgi:hypothetical protein
MIAGDDTVSFVVERDRAEGNKHHLFVQRDGTDIAFAALISREELAPIWRHQRDVRAGSIAKGLLGRMSKNHAMKGSSPTIWLQDDRKAHGHEVADVLWSWPGVIDLAKLGVAPTKSTEPVDDTFDDCPGVDPWLIGSDGAERRPTVALRSDAIRRFAARCSCAPTVVSAPAADKSYITQASWTSITSSEWRRGTASRTASPCARTAIGTLIFRLVRRH